jgi:glycosyltransferase involved in cell wall biosynthesis
MNERIILAGNQLYVDSYYLKSKIFAFTSSSEGFPNVIGEAMSAGLPVVAFDCVAGPNELIHNEINGLLVPVLDFELFRTKLKQLIENKDLRDKLGMQARESIHNNSINIIGDKYLDFICKYSKPTRNIRYKQNCPF